MQVADLVNALTFSNVEVHRLKEESQRTVARAGMVYRAVGLIWKRVHQLEEFKSIVDSGDQGLLGEGALKTHNVDVMTDHILSALEMILEGIHKANGRLSELRLELERAPEVLQLYTDECQYIPLADLKSPLGHFQSIYDQLDKEDQLLRARIRASKEFRLKDLTFTEPPLDGTPAGPCPPINQSTEPLAHEHLFITSGREGNSSKGKLPHNSSLEKIGTGETLEEQGTEPSREPLSPSSATSRNPRPDSPTAGEQGATSLSNAHLDRKDNAKPPSDQVEETKSDAGTRVNADEKLQTAKAVGQAKQTRPNQPAARKGWARQVRT